MVRPSAGGSNWQNLTPYAQGTPSNPVRANGGGGNGAQLTGARDILDARRMMAGNQIPSAQYPDGFIGTIQSRREDRMLDAVKNKLNARSYSRGVHKGERIDPQDYYWPDNFTPQTALEYEARGEKWSCKGALPIEHLVNDGKDMSADDKRVLFAQFGMQYKGDDKPVQPAKMRQLLKLRPNWI